ncbi:claudin-2 [Lepisosteus oculatus]|uniref:claudin-2 n=1 Tax=Lepisosteus oculatus TaxID=7918 RepID=UPI00371D1E08
MGSAGLELVGFLLALLGLLGTLVSTVLPYWRTTAFIGSNIITAVGYVKGLWMECAYYSTGSFQCETYNSLLALPADLQAARAMMVMSCVLSVLGLAVSCLGMQCTTCLQGQPVKPRAAGAGGCCLLLAGLLCLVPIAWTTNEVVKLFHNPIVPSSYKSEIGECLYVGMAAALLSLMGGGVLCLSCCGEEPLRGSRGGRPRGGRGMAGYPYPGSSAPHPRAHANAMTFRNPLAHAGVHAASKSPPHSSHSEQSRSSAPTPSPGQRGASGYDLTGYV